MGTNMDETERMGELAGLAQFLDGWIPLRLSLEDWLERTEPTVISAPTSLAVYAQQLQDRGRMMRRPKGLCPDRTDHVPHAYTAAGLGELWCTARQEDREPGRSERVLRGRQGYQTLMTIDETHRLAALSTRSESK